MLDLVVIGAGLSGLMGAYAAATAGLKVRVINKGLGAMHWAAGTVDLLGYMAADQQRPLPNPLSAIENLSQTNPNHPYAKLDKNTITNALDAFVLITAEGGLPYTGAKNHSNNLLLPSPVGAPRPTYLAPSAQLAGDLNRSEPMLIVGFDGMRDFYPQLIAENLRKSGIDARAEQLPISLLTSRRDANTVHLATELDDGARRARLGQELKRLVKDGERVGLPAVLGFNRHMITVADLEKITRTPLFEIPTLPPSVPGMRLYKALRQKLQGMGVRIEPAMEVISAEATACAELAEVAVNGQSGHIQSVSSATSARPMKHRAHNYLLATGGILGGGFNSDSNGRIWETIFNLPLTIPHDRSQWFHSSFLSKDGHPVFRGGITVNAHFQPVNENGTVIYDNLWAAGNLLSGSDAILERSTEGAAIATGFAAGTALMNTTTD